MGLPKNTTEKIGGWNFLYSSDHGIFNVHRARGSPTRVSQLIYPNYTALPEHLLPGGISTDST